MQPSFFFCMHVCVFLRGVSFISEVLSFVLQKETGTELVLSQGTIRGKVTVAHACESLL